MLTERAGGEKAINRDLEAKARALAGTKGYVTNLAASGEFVINSYHRLFQIEYQLFQKFAAPCDSAGRSLSLVAA
ncbi:hypothetical protein [Haloechinothrix alba]|nr:hypothetical protein [Haloechinothrix alba]